MEKQVVYIVSRCIDYEGSDTVKAFKKRESADDFIKWITDMDYNERFKNGINFSFDSLIVEEMEVY